MAEFICVQCKFIGTPKRKKRGSTRAEVRAWLMFPLGLPYTLWRMFSKKPVCRSCEGEGLIPADSIAGQRMIKIAAGENVAPMPQQADVKSARDGPMLPKPEAAPRPKQDSSTW